MKKYKDIGIYDFSDYAEEITGDALFKINGGAEVENSNEGIAGAKPGDTITRKNGDVIVLKQIDIDIANEKLGNNGNDDTGNASGSSGAGSSSGTYSGTTSSSSGAGGGSVSGGTTSSSGSCNGSVSGGTSSGDTSDTENKITTGSWGRVDETYRNTNMQQYKETEVDKKMNGSNLFSLVGCKMQAAAKMVSTILGKTFSMEQINDTFDTNKDGLLPRDEIEAGIKQNLPNGKSVKMDYWELSLSKEILDKEIPALGGTTYVLGRAEDVHGGQHWVVLEGYSVNGFGQVQFDVNYTSANDKNFGRTYILGQPNENQTNTHRISKIETFTIY